VQNPTHLQCLLHPQPQHTRSSAPCSCALHKARPAAEQGRLAVQRRTMHKVARCVSDTGASADSVAPKMCWNWSSSSTSRRSATKCFVWKSTSSVPSRGILAGQCMAAVNVKGCGQQRAGWCFDCRRMPGLAKSYQNTSDSSLGWQVEQCNIANDVAVWANYAYLSNNTLPSRVEFRQLSAPVSSN
jgi:hypothetical protein